MKGFKRTPIITGLLLACACLIFTSPVLAAGRGKAVSESLLPTELKKTEVADHYRAMGTKEAGVIQTIIGHVVVANEDLSRGYYAAAGDKILEKDVIFTLKDSRCRVRLNGEDIITMGENARVGVKSFSTDGKTKKSILSMAKGKAMFYALRLLHYRSAVVEVATPTAVAGVRGTKWGVDVNNSSQTNIYSYEGTVTVSSIQQTGQITRISGGQGVNTSGAGLGTVFLVPPSVLNTFAIETHAPAPVSSNQTTTTGTATGGFTQLTQGGLTASEPVQTTTTSGAVSTTTIGNVTLVDTSGITQQQNTQQQNTQTETAHTNYMMTSVFENGNLNGHVIFDGVVSGPGPAGGPDEAYRPIPATPPATRTVVGSDAYLEWGYWSSYVYVYPDPSSNGITYYVGGTQTTESQIAALKSGGIVANYSGTAIGGHYQDGTVTNMSGTFGATVNFATNAVTNFYVDVSGGGQSACISGASGTLGNAGPRFSEFQVSGGAPYVFVSGSQNVSDYKASGVIYGNNGQAVGGDWVIQGVEGSSAGGVFRGTR
jgi:hypothetical protein